MNNVKSVIELALRAARDSGVERSSITRVIGTAGPITDLLSAMVAEEGKPEEQLTIESFTKFLASTTKMEQAPWLRPGLGNEGLSTATALQLLLSIVEFKALDALKRGHVHYPRLGRLRSPAGPTSRILFHLDASSKPDDVPHGNAKHCALWIGRCDTVDSWLRPDSKTWGFPSDVGLLDLGVIRLVTAVSLHEKAYTVADAVSVLPVLQGEQVASNVDVRLHRGECSLESVAIDPERTTRIYALQLRRMHEESFLHQGIRTMISDYWDPASTLSATCTAASTVTPRRSSEGILRNLLGLRPLGTHHPFSEWVHSLLGNPNTGARAAALSWAETRLNKKLSPSQRRFFMEFESPLTVLHCVPGAGKTLFIEIFFLLLSEYCTDHPVRLLVTEQNVEMRDECWSRLVKIAGSGKHVVRVGFDKVEGVDLWEDWLEEAADSGTQVERSILAAVDSCIGMVARKLAEFAVDQRINDLEAHFLISRIVRLMAKRHEYLDRHVYQSRTTAQVAAVTSIRCLISTTTNVAKYDALVLLLDALGEESGDSTIWWHFRDEYTQEDLPMTVVGLRPEVDVLILSGDRWQAPQTSVAHTSNQQDEGVRTLGRTPGSLNTSLWVDRSKGVNVHYINETWRLGKTMVRVLSQILPGTSDMVTADGRPDDTLFLPIVFDGLNDWVYADNSADAEIYRSQLFFAHALCVIALEVVLAVCHPKKGDATSGVLVISCLNNPLDALELYLFHHLQSCCLYLHEACALPLPTEGRDAYAYPELVRSELIKLMAVIPSGGKDRRSAVLLGPHRRRSDLGPEGVMCESRAMLVGISRAVERCHCLTEDFRRFIFTPTQGELKREGVALGLQDVSVLQAPEKVKAATANESRRQMPWARLAAVAEREYSGELDVPEDYARILRAKDWRVSPTFASNGLWRNLMASPDSAACTPLLRRLSESREVANGLLSMAWNAYPYTPWHNARPDAIASVRKQVEKNSFSDVFGSEES